MLRLRKDETGAAKDKMPKEGDSFGHVQAKGEVVGKIYIDENLCAGCGICIEFCPKKVLARSGKRSLGGIHLVRIENSAACTHCRLCELYCSSFAISVEGEEDE